MLAVLGWIVFGLVIGLIARAIMPGAQPMGFMLTALLGIAGSFVGGWLGTFLSGALRMCRQLVFRQGMPRRGRSGCKNAPSNQRAC